MLIVALKMLARDRAKFLSIVMGVTFAVFLIVEQGCVFTGLMRRSGAIILDTKSVDLWVFDARVKTVDDLRALKDSDLWRVRDVEGVEWATRWFKGAARAKRLDGRYENVLVIGVDDAGPGVARSERFRIFERFARGSAARHRVGTGLGLALVAEHARAHGGEAWVEDRPGGGARFKVSLGGVS